MSNTNVLFLPYGAMPIRQIPNKERSNSLNILAKNLTVDL